MIKLISKLALMVTLAGCNGSSDPHLPDQRSDSTSTPLENLQTTNVKVQFNLSASESLGDSEQFSVSDPFTYNNAVGISVCNFHGESEDLQIYFVRNDVNHWQVFFTLDDVPLDIEGSNSHSTLQNTAILQFSPTGDFVRQQPYIIKSQEIGEAGNKFHIEFDFYTYPSTSLNEPFSATKLEANGC